MKNYNSKLKNYSDKTFLLVSAYRYAERTISSSIFRWSLACSLYGFLHVRWIMEERVSKEYCPLRNGGFLCKQSLLPYWWSHAPPISTTFCVARWWCPAASPQLITKSTSIIQHTYKPSLGIVSLSWEFPRYSQICFSALLRNETFALFRPFFQRSEHSFLKSLGRRDWRRTEKISTKKFSCFSKMNASVYLIPFAPHAFVFQRQEMRQWAAFAFGVPLDINGFHPYT